METVRLSESFQDLLKTKPLKKSKRFILHVIEGTHPPRFGVLVPKRLAKRAVDRNTIKRLVRQACRNCLGDYQGAVLVRLKQTVHHIPDSERSVWWTELLQLLSCLSGREQSGP